MSKAVAVSIGSIVIGLAISGAFMSIDKLFFVGVALAMLGGAAMLHKRSMAMIDRVNRPADDAYDLGYQMGYDRGYREGHREARPVVVSLRDGGPLSPQAMR